MHKALLFVLSLTFVSVGAGWALDTNQGLKLEFSQQDGQTIVRSTTPGINDPGIAMQRHLPYRNPHILANVVWVDRAHENAIAEDVDVTPDGAGIFAGWWLNNMRYAAYASAGLEAPLWRFNLQTQWTMPVAASNDKYAGAAGGLPAYLWNHDSPLFDDAVNFDPGYSGGGVAFSADGNTLATVAANGQSDAILIVYDVTARDTIFTRHFVPTQGLYGVDISADGSTVVISNYGQLVVYSVPDGELRGELYNYSQNISKISADGSLIVMGTFGGSVYLYEWTGAQYDYRWATPTGHDWVTALDISQDGSTVACGTMDFEGNQVVGGKFLMVNAADGVILIDYADYGDMVAGVALSADGRYAIAGCWGKYGTTFGDVVTCFIRDTDIPIFQLLDDTDESGSVFGVAISDSGHYAAAGGKAVHAREWGNGGMLYSIKIRDPLTHDVATAALTAPGEFLAPGESVTPSAMFLNVGETTETFDVTCTVTNLDNSQVIYSSTATIPDLPSFGNASAFFSPDFTMPSDGRFRMEVSANLAGDQDTANDHLSLVLRSWHDLKGVSVTSPFSEATVNWPVTPIATFKNFGSYYETVNITVSIRDSAGTEVFSAMNTVFDLGPYLEEELTFDAWYPSVTGAYTAVFNAEVPGDFYPDDNTVSRTFLVVNEMLYDDNSSDAAYWVDAYPSSVNRKFAQRFAPNFSAPFTITNARFFQPNIQYTGAFDYIGLTKEIDGLPDTTNFLDLATDPPLPGPDNWASFDYNIAVDNNDPLWFVMHWADVPDVYGPYVGADVTGAIDTQSYWYSDNNPNGWNQWMFSDWMIRMTLQSATGIDADYVSGLPDRVSLRQNYPNPFNPSTHIEFALRNAGQVSLDIYNNLGQKIRTLVDSHFDSGVHSVTWDGKSDTGNDVASGLYYYRLTSGDFRISKKMLMVK